jgi:hypothetical protein
LEGSVMSTRTEWNQAYYGQPYAARQIVSQMQAVNPGADPLRGVLTRFGGAAQAAAIAPEQFGEQPGSGYAPAYPQSGAPPLQAAPQRGAGGRGPIQQQPLSSPR